MTTPTRLDAQELMVHAPFLRALAHSLVQDQAAAEDLVQHAWLRALENPPADAGMLRSWLATVVRNLATDHRRSAAARDRREQASAPREHVPSVQEIARREAMRQDVVDAVLRLPEPARSAVLLRYYEGMPPREIARVLEVPVETVRTRLKRGLARLRAQLDDHYGDRSLWSATLALLAFPRTAPSPVVSVVSAVLRLLLTPAGMSIAALAVVLSAGASWWSLSSKPSSEPASTPASELAETSSAIAPQAPLANPSVAAPHAAEARREPQLAALEGPGIRGRLLDGEEPIEGRIVYLTGIAFSLREPEQLGQQQLLLDSLFHRECASDAQGRFHFDRLSEGLYYLGLAPSPAGRHALRHVVTVGEVHPELRAMIEQKLGDLSAQGGVVPPRFEPLMGKDVVDVELTSAAAGELHGRVVDAAGEAVAGAEVLAIPELVGSLLQTTPDVLDLMVQHLGRVVQRTRSEADGRFAFVGPMGATIVLARSPDHRPTRVDCDVIAEDSSSEPLRVVLSTAVRFSVQGTVVDSAGRPLVDVPVVAVREGEISDWHRPEPGTSEGSLAHQTRTDEEGRYSLIDRAGESTARWDLRDSSEHELVLVATAPGCAPQTSAPLRRDGSVETRDFRLAPGGPLSVVVTDHRGEALNGARVEIRGPQGLVHRLRSDAKGHARSAPIAHGTAQLRVQLGGFDTHEQELEWTARTGVVAVALAAAALRVEGRVLDPEGRPVPFMLPLAPGLDHVRHQRGSYFSLWASAVHPASLLELPIGTSRLMMATHGSRTARIESDGNYTIDLGEDWPGDEVFIVLETEGLPPQVELRTVGDHADFVLDVGAALGQRSRVQFRAFDAATGARLLEAGVDFYRGDEQQGHAFYHDLGLMTGNLVGGGRYDFRVRAPGHAATWIRDVEIVAGSVREPFEVRLEPESRLKVKVLPPESRDGDPPSSRGVTVNLYDVEGRRIAGQGIDDQGELILSGLAAGNYSVHASDGRDGRARAEALVLPGSLSELELQLQPGTPIVVELSPRLREAFGGGALRLRDRQGRRALDRFFRQVWSSSITTHALPGDYVLELVGAGIPHRECELRVPDDGSEVRVFFDLD